MAAIINSQIHSALIKTPSSADNFYNSDQPAGADARYRIVSVSSQVAGSVLREPLPKHIPAPCSSFYRPELDVLRLCAFLGVFRFHFAPYISDYLESWTAAPRWLSVANSATYAGAFGVDLFFVLSAYLITELLLREKSQYGTLNVKAFYLRRILRIWPLYFFFVGIALIPAFNPIKSFSGRYVVAFLALAGNWSIVAWGWPARSIVQPLWTVSIEEQFYLLWPPIVRNLSRDRIILASAAMLVISTATRVIVLTLHGGGPNSVWCNTLGRLDPIAAGILIAALLGGRMPAFRNSLRFCMLCCGVVPLVLVAHYWKIYHPATLQWIPTLAGFPIVAAGCTLIVLSVLGISVRFPAMLIYLGKISYGLYVYHALGPLLTGRVLTGRLFPAQQNFFHLIVRELLALTITVLLAATSYEFLEKPFLRLKERFAQIRSRPV